MITPEDIIKKRIKIRISKDFKEDIVVRTDIRLGDKRMSLLIGHDIVLRFQYQEEKKNKTLERLKVKILNARKIFISKRQRLIQKLLVSDRQIRELLNKDKNELIKRSETEFDDLESNIVRRQKSLNSIANKLKFNVTKPHKEYLCKKCHGFRPGPDLITTSKPTCVICKNKLESYSIKHIDNDVVGYLTGYWLEDYIATILNKLGWKAWSSPTLMVYGVSGASHQIDVLAIKDGRILIIECKSGEFSPTEVMKFLGKYYDIRCHKALAIAIGKIHSDAKKFIEKNAAISYYDNINSYNKLYKEMSRI